MVLDFMFEVGKNLWEVTRKWVGHIKDFDPCVKDLKRKREELSSEVDDLRTELSHAELHPAKTPRKVVKCYCKHLEELTGDIQILEQEAEEHRSSNFFKRAFFVHRTKNKLQEATDLQKQNNFPHGAAIDTPPPASEQRILPTARILTVFDGNIDQPYVTPPVSHQRRQPPTWEINQYQPPHLNTFEVVTAAQLYLTPPITMSKRSCNGLAHTTPEVLHLCASSSNYTHPSTSQPSSQEPQSQPPLLAPLSLQAPLSLPSSPSSSTPTSGLATPMSTSTRFDRGYAKDIVEWDSDAREMDCWSNSTVEEITTQNLSNRELRGPPNTMGQTHYLRVRSSDKHLVTEVPNTDKHSDDFLLVGGNWGCPAGTTDRAERVPHREGHPGDEETKRKPLKEKTGAIRTALQFEKRSASELLGYIPIYRHAASKEFKVTDYPRKSPEREDEIPQGWTVGSSSSAPQHFISCTQSNRGYFLSPDIQDEGMDDLQPVDLDALALASDDEGDTVQPELTWPLAITFSDQLHDDAPPCPPAVSLRKRKRVTGKTVTESSARDGPAIDAPAEVWDPLLMHDSRPITTEDSVDESCDLAVDLSKSMLLPLDMAKHNNLSNDVLVWGSIQQMTSNMQKMHLDLERSKAMIEEWRKSTALFVDAHEALKGVEKATKAAEKSAAAAKAKVEKVKVKSKLAEEELKKLKAKQAELEKHCSDKVLDLKGKLFAEGWKAAPYATGVDKSSPFYQDIPVPPKTVATPTKGGPSDAAPGKKGSTPTPTGEATPATPFAALIAALPSGKEVLPPSKDAPRT